MKKGDLRQFTVDGGGLEFGAGDIFMVLDIVQPRSAFPKQVSFLVNGTIMTGWGLPWVMNNSEVISEAG